MQTNAAEYKNKYPGFSVRLIVSLKTTFDLHLLHDYYTAFLMFGVVL